MRFSEIQLIDILKDLKPVQWDGSNLQSQCPWCKKREFFISTGDNHPFQCWRKKHCGITGNIYSLLRRLGKEDLLASLWNQVSSSLSVEIEKKEEKQESISLITIKPPIGFRRVFEHPYLKSRGFDSFEKYKVGVTNLDPKLKDYVVFLIEEMGEIKGYVARHTDASKLQSKKDRYRNSKTDFSQLLLGWEDIVYDTAVLVEGFFDKDNVDKVLTDKNCCCTFGAKISQEQIYRLKLRGVRNVILMWDSDVISIIQDAAFELRRDFNVSVAYIGEQDPGEASFEKIITSIENRQTPEEFFRTKVKLLNL